MVTYKNEAVPCKEGLSLKTGQPVVEQQQNPRVFPWATMNARYKVKSQVLSGLGQSESWVAAMTEISAASSWDVRLQEKMHTVPAVLELRKSLEAEREAIFNFLFTAVDDTLTPSQEAFLDIQSYPFCPDIWEITNLLAQRRKVRACGWLLSHQ